jgi:hypothetical protein
LAESDQTQNDFVRGGNEFTKQMGIGGKPISAGQLRQMLLEAGINPNDNEFSQDIIVAREA